jgi:hypothetical protein
LLSNLLQSHRGNALSLTKGRAKLTPNEENPKGNVARPADESVLLPDDEDPGDKAETEKKELDELQANDPGNQGA